MKALRVRAGGAAGWCERIESRMVGSCTAALGTLNAMQAARCLAGGQFDNRVERILGDYL